MNMQYKFFLFLASTFLTNATSPDLIQTKIDNRKAEIDFFRKAEYHSFVTGTTACCWSGIFFMLSKLLPASENATTQNLQLNAECIAPKAAATGAIALATGMVFRQRRKQAEQKTCRLLLQKLHSD